MIPDQIAALDEAALITDKGKRLYVILPGAVEKHYLNSKGIDWDAVNLFFATARYKIYLGRYGDVYFELEDGRIVETDPKRVFTERDEILFPRVCEYVYRQYARSKGRMYAFGHFGKIDADMHNILVYCNETGTFKWATVLSNDGELFTTDLGSFIVKDLNDINIGPYRIDYA